MSAHYQYTSPDGIKHPRVEILAKTVAEMNYAELQEEGQKRAAECGGCNPKAEDGDDGQEANTGT